MVTQPVPTGSPVTQGFNQNLTAYNNGTGHTGLDWGLPAGTPVRAIADGTVLIADWSGNLRDGNDFAAGYEGLLFMKTNPGEKRGAGIVLALDHGPVVSTMSHLSETHLNPGDRVKEGQIVGLSGNTGISTGPHLHFEILAKPYAWNNGMYGRVDPMPYLSGAKPVTYAQTAEKENSVTQYKFETQYNAPAFTRGRPKPPTDIVIHHYGEDDATYESSVNWLVRPEAGTSAHYVVDAGRVACLVSPNDTAYHAGDWPVNQRSIGIENHPIWTPEREATLVQLCADLEETYGGLNYSVHQNWFGTACPGRWVSRVPHIINGVNAELARRKVGGNVEAAKPAVKPGPKPLKAVLPGVPAYTHIPGRKQGHVVSKGQTLGKIAQHYGTSVAWLVKVNNLKDPNQIRVGQKLRVR